MCLPLNASDWRVCLSVWPASTRAEGKSARVVSEALAGLQVKGGPVARMRVLYEVGGCLVFLGMCRGRQPSNSGWQRSI
jgi:hypothetical protein